MTIDAMEKYTYLVLTRFSRGKIRRSVFQFPSREDAEAWILRTSPTDRDFTASVEILNKTNAIKAAGRKAVENAISPGTTPGIE